MKNKIISVSIIATVILSITGCKESPTPIKQTKLVTLNKETVKKSIKQVNSIDIKNLPIFKDDSIKITAFTKHENLYHIKGVVASAPFEAFIANDLKEVVFGKGFNVQTKKPLKINIDTKVYLKDAAYTIGTGTDEYLLFTDPECPYCMKLENMLPLLKKDAKFYVFLFPLSFHKNAKQMSYYIMSQKTNADKNIAMHSIANGSTEYKKVNFSEKVIKELDNSLKKQINIASSFGVNGTPSIFDINGAKVKIQNILRIYNIKEPTDMQGISFLKKNNLEITLNSNNKPPLYIFTSLNKSSNLLKIKETVEKYTNTNSIFLYIKLDKEMSSLNRLKAVYSQRNNKQRVVALNSLIETQKLNQHSLEELKKITKDEETRYLPVSYIMQKMKLNTEIDFLIIDKNGKQIVD